MMPNPIPLRRCSGGGLGRRSQWLCWSFKFSVDGRLLPIGATGGGRASLSLSLCLELYPGPCLCPLGELNLANRKVGSDLIHSEIEFDIHSS